MGEKASRTADERPWTLTIDGAVARPQVWSLDTLHALPRVQRTVDIHCVTRWSRLDVPFEGVLLNDLLAATRPEPGARFVWMEARSDRAHGTSLPLDILRSAQALLVFQADGIPLEPIHGGPMRLVVPGRYFYKSVKWIERITLRTEDRLGYWEAQAGYHNGADPWREERYIAPDAPPRVLERALATRDLSGLDLRGIGAAGRDLTGLKATGALLRDAHFEGATLDGADFSGANLSNAHFDRASLRGVCFVGADVEGACFDGADLTDTDFTNASCFGTTFDGAALSGARLDTARDSR